ncbi:16S rRNA (guanine(966)-N(2))-methyltransferase RsmD [Mycoplasma sp. M5725]|uniref:16S rRNA (Guanine(966)-N(2))-methyltransferase RsmD n=1 Tax=Mycoplasma phocimorsus TaxID=3045839 RepID=A0AAJ1PRZ7_9MOLU|nr:16S rRNA (guanine(966)-N(2))-methyltransferase RsmD [Mycoplasma phocimorsus]MDJ1645693.1 16S rRNA (guanine(966)-N(2))-methyltransferase RsmD [Mycoplasma phocimorsus]
MIKIISGELRHRKLISHINKKIRPTQHRIREAIFNYLRFNENKKRFLDLFAGTGAMGIEAVSNGYEFVDFVEKGIDICNVIKQNIDLLKLKNVNLFCKDFLDYLYLTTETYSVIFIDPPYDDISAYNKSLNIIKNRSILEPEGIVIVETRRKKDINLDGYEILSEKNYGLTTIFYLTKSFNEI